METTIYVMRLPKNYGFVTLKYLINEWCNKNKFQLSTDNSNQIKNT